MEIKAPEFPESISEGELVAWYASEGDYVERDDVIADIETEKTTMEISAPVSGRVTSLKLAEGDMVESSQLLAEIDESAEPPEVSSVEEIEEEHVVEDGRHVAPAAAKLAEETDIDLSEVAGTGRRGTVTKADVQLAIETRAKELKDAQPDEAKATSSAADTVGKSRLTVLEKTGFKREERRVPMSRIRATIARRLVSVQQESAMLTTFNEVDMAPIQRMRAQYQEEFQKRHNGTRLGIMSFFIRASVEALKRFPSVNASLDADEIVYHGYYDIGVAVSTERGLVVPIIRDADALGLHQIEDQISEYSEKARVNRLPIEDMQGGTFTISNGGVFGSLMSTPILNPPQTAILGMHTIQDRPVAENDEIVIRPMMYLALSYDHRMIDGSEAVRFLVTIKEMVEDPARILLEL